MVNFVKDIESKEKFILDLIRWVLMDRGRKRERRIEKWGVVGRNVGLR